MKFVLLNSGGLLSKLSAIYIRGNTLDGDEIHSLTLDFGNLTDGNYLDSAQKIANDWCDSHTVLKAQMITSDNKALTPTVYDSISGKFAPISMISKEEKESTFGYVHNISSYPQRRVKLFSEAASFARLIGAERVITGHDDNMTYDWLKKWNDLIALYKHNPTFKDIVFESPFYGQLAEDIILQLGLTEEEAYADVR